MTVWCLFRIGPYEHGELFGIYSSEWQAKAAKERAECSNLRAAPMEFCVVEKFVDTLDAEWPV